MKKMKMKTKMKAKKSDVKANAKKSKRKPTILVLKPASLTSIGHENLSRWLRGEIDLKWLRSVSIFGCRWNGDRAEPKVMIDCRSFGKEVLASFDEIVARMATSVEDDARAVECATCYEFQAFYATRSSSKAKLARIMRVTLDFGSTETSATESSMVGGLMAHTLRMNDRVQQTMVDAQKTLVDTIETRDRQLEELGAIVESWKDKFFKERDTVRGALDGLCTALGIPTVSDQSALFKRVEQLEARLDRLRKSMEDPS